MVKCKASAAVLFGFRFWFCHFLAGCSLGSYLNSLHLRFLTYKKWGGVKRKGTISCLIGFSGKLSESIYIEHLLLSRW